MEHDGSPMETIADSERMTLDALGVGTPAIISTVGGEGALRQHFLDMGVIPGAQIEFVKAAPMGDPLEFRIHGYELTLRKDGAAKIEVEPVETSADDDAEGQSSQGKLSDEGGTARPGTTVSPAFAPALLAT